MKQVWRAAAVLILLAAIAAAVLLSNPLRRSDDAVQRWLLEAAPIGSKLEDLERVAEEKGWRIEGMWNGYTPHSGWGGIDGDKIVWIYLGGYRNLFRTDLDSFWAFDESGRLTGVVSRRMTDAL
jgi:hypothetical protein